MPVDADSYSDSGAGANSDSSSEDGVDDAEGKQERAMAMRRHGRCGFHYLSLLGGSPQSHIRLATVRLRIALLVEIDRFELPPSRGSLTRVRIFIY